MADVRLLKGGIAAVPGGAKLFPVAGEPSVTVYAPLNFTNSFDESGRDLNWDANPANVNPELHYTISRDGYADVQIDAAFTTFQDTRLPINSGTTWGITSTTADGTSIRIYTTYLAAEGLTVGNVDSNYGYDIASYGSLVPDVVDGTRIDGVTGINGPGLVIVLTQAQVPLFSSAAINLTIGGATNNPYLLESDTAPTPNGNYQGVHIDLVNHLIANVGNTLSYSIADASIVTTPPTVEAGGPYEGNENTAIQLNATVTPGTDPNPTLDWKETTILGGTFSSASIEDPTFTPATTGTYLLTLTATPSDSFVVNDIAELVSEAVTDQQETNPFTIRISS